MKKLVMFLFVGLLFAWVYIGVAQAQKFDLSDAAIRDAYVEQLAQKSQAEKAEAEAWARARGIPIRLDDGWNIFELMYLVDGRPVYNMTHNANAAITTAADKVRNTSPYSVDGDGLTIGIWDGGGVLTTHDEFQNACRSVTVMDGAAATSHATHVGGTIGASGVVTGATGMAPCVDIHSYKWDNDESEMAGRAASYAGEPGKIYVSNHSYGHISGWVYTTWETGPAYAHHWSPYAPWSGASSIENNFGQYDTTARTWDEIVYNAPYFLPFKSAGNDRNDNPSPGETVYYSTNGGVTWNSISYSAATCPEGDGVVKSGYDTVQHRGVAKNLMTLGAVDDAVSTGTRHLPSATMAVFSSWGPADDGRIKPDIMANGVSLYSPVTPGPSTYGSKSGTSMSAPNASGSAILLVEYYGTLFPGQAMRASTLKALIIHTADNLGNPGPDYSYGWGLMNTEAAAALIKQQYDNPGTDIIVEGLLDGGNPNDSYAVDSDGVDPLRGTLCWTDPPGTATSAHNDSTIKLVNDLDMRIVGPSGTYYPYVLNPASPASNATNGDNIRDNVEQIYIASPAAGTYTVEVSHKGSLTDGQQHYSLILSGGGAVLPPYCSQDVPKNIPDPGTVTSTLSFTDTGSILDVDVKLDITHTYCADLDVFLIAPDGTRVELFTDVGGSGNNFTDTILDDEAPTPITAGFAPFTGSYRPEGSLAALDGNSITGTWTLEVTDDAGAGTGTLNEWCLIIIVEPNTCPPPPAPSNPDPPHGANKVPINTMLSWSSPATTGDLYAIDGEVVSQQNLPSADNPNVTFAGSGPPDDTGMPIGTAEDVSWKPVVQSASGLSILFFGFDTATRSRLTGLGYSVTGTTTVSDLTRSNLQNYDVLWIDVGVNPSTYASQDSEIQDWVSLDGGGFVVVQPNITGAQVTAFPAGFEVRITDKRYGALAATIVDPTHPIVQGLTDTDLSADGDTVHNTDIGALWDIVAVDAAVPDEVALLAGEYSSGRLTFSTGNFNPSAYDPGSDQFIIQMVDWLGGAGVCPTTWDVYLGTSPTALSLVCADLTEPNCDPGILVGDTTYHWQVVAKSCCGSQAPGPVWSFTTTHVCEPPSDPDPPDGATDVPLDTTLSWNNSGRGDLFAIDSDLDELFLLDQADGSETLISSTSSGPSTPAALAFDGTNMYTIDHAASGGLYTLDLGTAVPTLVGTTGISGWQGLAADPTDGGQLYGTTQPADNSLYRIAGDGTPTLVGAIGSVEFQSGLTFDASGTLWGIEFFTGNINIIDKSTGATTLVTTTLEGFNCIDFDADGELWAHNVNTDSLYIIDLTTGVATLIGANTTDFVKGLSFNSLPGELSSVFTLGPRVEAKKSSTSAAVAESGGEVIDIEETRPIELNPDLLSMGRLRSDKERAAIAEQAAKENLEEAGQIQQAVPTVGRYPPAVFESVESATVEILVFNGHSDNNPGGEYNTLNAIDSIIARSGILDGPIAVSCKGPAEDGRHIEATITYTTPGEIAQVRTAAEVGIETDASLDVVVCGAQTDGGLRNGDVQAKLLGTGQFNSVSIINVQSVTPTLGELQAFDAVLVYSNAEYADSTALGDVMADYVDSGGGVVSAVFEVAGSMGYNMKGRWLSGGYPVIQYSSAVTGVATLGTIHQPSHPTMAGVSSFNGGSSGYRPSTTALTPGATLIAEWDDGCPLVAVKDIGGTARVVLGFYPPSSDAQDEFWNSTTDGDLLMANALTYAAGSGVCPTTYDVYLGTSPTALSLVCADLTGPNCDPGMLPYCTTYYWQVVAKNCCGQTPGPIWSFTTVYYPCWDCPTQCHGDADCDGCVKGLDFLALKASWLKCYPNPAYNPCADFDRDGCVKSSDFLTLKNWWFKCVPELPADCPPSCL